jgi:4-hydroxy-tetrahydrodipicolinate synthase
VFQTPFTLDEEIDFGVLRDEIAWMFDQGIDGIVMAMVSEVLRLSTDERVRLATAACDSGLGRGGVVISVGAESTHSALRFAGHAEAAGATAVMAIPPVSTAALEQELFGYYESLLDALEIPVIVQDASGYVGRPMSIEMQSRLLHEFGDRVLYKPEAVPIGPKLTELREATGGRARVFEGSGGVALVDSYARGIVGTMPGADLCWAIVALWKALEEGDRGRVEAINGPLTEIVSIQTSLDAFLAVEKHLLFRQGVFPNTVVRSPVGYRLDAATRAEVDHLFDRLREAVEQPLPDSGSP